MKGDLWFFEQDFSKNLCQNFERRITSKRTSLIFKRLTNEFREEIALLVDGLVTHGVNREPQDIAKEIKKLSFKLKTKKIIIAYFYLVGPTIRNEILKRVSRIEGYPTTGALKLDIMFNLLMPMFQDLYNNLKVNNIEASAFIKTVIFETKLDLSQDESVFPSYEGSSGFIESQFLINNEPIHSQILKTEDLIRRKNEQILNDVSVKTNLINLIRSQIGAEELDIKAVQASLNPMQQILSEGDEIERHVETCVIRKRMMSDHEKASLRNSIGKSVKGVYSNIAKDIVKIKNDKPYSTYFKDIEKKFNEYKTPGSKSIELQLIELYNQNIKRLEVDYKLKKGSQEINEVDLRQLKMDAIPSFPQITDIIENEIIGCIESRLQ